MAPFFITFYTQRETMPNSNTVNEYNLTSSQSDFTISFPYQKQAYVSVKVEDEARADVSSSYSGVLIDATTYQFQDSGGNPELIPSGYRVTFTRNTAIGDDLFSFAAGTVIRPDALAEAMKSVRDYTEERHDQNSNIILNAQTDAVTQATAQSKAARDLAEDYKDLAQGYKTEAYNYTYIAGATPTANAEYFKNLTEGYKDDAYNYTYKLGATPTANAEYYAEQALLSQQAAEAALATFNNKFHGAYADDTAVVAVINADADLTLDEGDIYFNTSTDRIRVWDGTFWQDAASPNVQTLNTTVAGNIGDVAAYAATISANSFLVRNSTTQEWEAQDLATVQGTLGVTQNTNDISTLTSNLGTTNGNVQTNTNTIASQGTDITSLTNRMGTAETNISNNDTDITNLQNGKQDNLTTSTAVSVASVESQVNGSAVNVRKVAVQSAPTATDTALVAEATLTPVTSGYTVLLSNVSTGDVVSVYAQGADCIVKSGTYASPLYLDGDASDNRATTGVTIAANTLATVTVLSDRAIVSGKDIA